MKQLILIAGLTIFASVANAQQYYGGWNNGYNNSWNRQPQHYDYTNQFGQPTGSANWNGNGWNYTNQFGQPTGSSTWNGNGWNYTNQFGQPRGSSRGW